MKLQKAGLWLVLALLIAAGIGSVVYTQFRLKGHREYLNLNESPLTAGNVENAQGQTITLTETKNGERKWVLKVKHIEYGKGNDIAVLADVKGVLYGSNQKVLFTFESPNGTFVRSENSISLRDGVRMFAPDQKVKIAAPEMKWSSKADTVVASGGVSMVKEGFGTSRARQAVFAMDFSHIQFTGGATSVIGGI